jgi:hypothetical protein
MPSPVTRKITDRDALVEFVTEAAWNDFAAVYVAPDVAALLGAPTSTRLPVLVERFVAAGHALAMPRPVLDFGKEER